ncbi:unnamed protein product [Rotaria socialis]|uniref:Uncharacterized protein n=1 Tax=Rotaria socialis TaxID=392032 RepID=A0A817RMV5_9BILA|nr:unnamed protein product [Rotaria socialis]CAF4554306.1 unnamed protein product [Rotaria socialis]
MHQSRGNNCRSPSGNRVDDENLKEMSEDLLIRDKRRFDLRIQELQAYLEKSNSNKLIMKLAEPALNVLFEQFQERSHETSRSELAHCIGLIGYVMLNEGELKFAEWIFECLNEVRTVMFKHN